MKKLFRKNEVVRFKNEEQKNQLLDIAVKYGINWHSGRKPFEAIIITEAYCIKFHKGKYLKVAPNEFNKEKNYKVISTKKFLKRFEENQEGGWFKGNREEDKRLYYINREENTFFGIDGNNDKWIVRNDASDITNVIKATNEEVLPRLKKEAEKRGFVKGAKIKCLIDSKEYRPNSEYYISGNNLNSLTLNQKVIMKKGIWAKVEEVYEPKVGDFGLFYGEGNNEMGYITKVNNNGAYHSGLGFWTNFTTLPQETEDIYNRIKNK